MNYSLTKVIDVDKDRCVNCHACIEACPVKFCNDGSGDYLNINSDMCIACGSCIKACTHDARFGIDDSESFFSDLQNDVPIITVVAPAVAATFPEQYLHLNGWLKSIGVLANFDVSFGAELTVKSYLEYVKANNPQTVIAQPCPALVSYIEIYKPELIPYLAPADSPMLHTIKMIKEYYGEYSNARIAVLSPCLAKRREFDETGFGDYNVTFKALAQYIDEQGINLKAFDETDYENPPAERAVLFSSPGGLLRTAQRELPEIVDSTRKIEGKEHIYHYLDNLPDMLNKGMSPLLVDCLNCSLGCNGGPGTNNIDKSPDEVEYHVEQRKKDMQARHEAMDKKKLKIKKNGSKLHESVDSYWKPGLYGRNYLNQSSNNYIKEPTEHERKMIYQKMKKYTDADIHNCTSCGYGS